ncbi:alpha/beta hydrolase [Paenibacillus swuensis]|uniref:Alpha/beta hydrolase n=1 Tax=Paenibacillus swuensis TaxID=1178515 RepID=A0A172TGN8_9BACL|nr:alpha/beta fold hydrolase [Paenibacillus swuensis]ANE46064.1 alpha/beta hydrolase [Paenibacillus swuensis]
MRKHPIRWSLLALLVVLVVAAAIYLNPYEPSAEAVRAMQSGEGVTVTNESKMIRFEPEKPNGTSIIYYPGALVKPASYATYARELAQDGYRTFIVKMPMNLAIIDADRADAVVEASKGETKRFIIGGHSLGGTMAARYAAKHPEIMKGVFFMASYPESKGDLAKVNMPVLSVTGSKDGVLNRDKYDTSKSLLPADAVFYEVEGGNHALFGSYGAQKGDQPASITPEEQLQSVTDMMLSWLSGLRP